MHAWFGGETTMLVRKHANLIQNTERTLSCIPYIKSTTSNRISLSPNLSPQTSLPKHLSPNISPLTSLL